MTDYINVLGYLVAKDRRYTETDEWALREDDIVVVGITDYAQKKLRDIVGVELPEKGRRVRKGEVVASIESVKAAADVYSPVSGIIVDVNEELYDKPELLNEKPYEAWLFKVKIENREEYEKLLSPEEYAEHIRRREKS